MPLMDLVSLLQRLELDRAAVRIQSAQRGRLARQQCAKQSREAASLGPDRVAWRKKAPGKKPQGAAAQSTPQPAPAMTRPKWRPTPPLVKKKREQERAKAGQAGNNACAERVETKRVVTKPRTISEQKRAKQTEDMPTKQAIARREVEPAPGKDKLLADWQEARRASESQNEETPIARVPWRKQVPGAVKVPAGSPLAAGAASKKIAPAGSRPQVPAPKPAPKTVKTFNPAPESGRVAWRKQVPGEPPAGSPLAGGAAARPSPGPSAKDAEIAKASAKNIGSKAVGVKSAAPKAENVNNNSPVSTKAVGTKAVVGGTPRTDTIKAEPAGGTPPTDTIKAEPAKAKKATPPKKKIPPQPKTREEYIAEIFRAADQNCDGILDRAEMFRVAQFCGFEDTESDFQEDFEELCENQNDVSSPGIDAKSFLQTLVDEESPYYQDDSELQGMLASLRDPS